MDTKTVYCYDSEGLYAGDLVLDKTDLSPSGAWQLPANSTEVSPPEFDATKQTCTLQNGAWVLKDISIIKETPEPTAEELKRKKYDAINAEYSPKLNGVIGAIQLAQGRAASKETIEALQVRYNALNEERKGKLKVVAGV